MILIGFLLSMGFLYWVYPNKNIIVVEDHGDRDNPVGKCHFYYWDFGLISNGIAFFVDQDELEYDIKFNKIYLVDCPKILILVLFDAKTLEFIEFVRVKDLKPFSQSVRYIAIDYTSYYLKKNTPYVRDLKKISLHVQKNWPGLSLSDRQFLEKRVLKAKLRTLRNNSRKFNN